MDVTKFINCKNGLLYELKILQKPAYISPHKKSTYAAAYCICGNLSHTVWKSYFITLVWIDYINFENKDINCRLMCNLACNIVSTKHIK